MEGSIGSGTPKLDWADAPERVRASVESLIGAGVVEAVSMPGGFNPGVASRLVFEDGSTAFVKDGRLARAPLEAEPLAAATDDFDCWKHLAQWPHLLADLDAGWATDRMEELLALQARWTDAVAGDALLHGDLRADQILFAYDRVVFVDWPHACTGPAWADVVMMILSVVLQGGPEPEEIVAISPSASAAACVDVTALAVAMAGGLLWYSTRPPPPGLPTVREFQRVQGRVLLDWIARSRGWTASRP